MSSLASFDALIRVRRPSRVGSFSPQAQRNSLRLDTYAQRNLASHPIEPPQRSEWRDPWYCRVSSLATDAGGQP